LQLSCVSLVDPSIVSEASGVRSVTISMTLSKFLTPKASLTHYLFFLWTFPRTDHNWQICYCEPRSIHTTFCSAESSFTCFYTGTNISKLLKSRTWTVDLLRCCAKPW
jgi:hypothetical protein